MRWQGFRVPVVLLVMVLALSLFLGSRWVYYKYNFKEPLVQELKANEAVQSFSIDQHEPVIRIVIKLGAVENLKYTYQNLHKSIQDILGNKPFQIELQDNRDSQLKKIFYNSQFAIYEAIMRGNFREMAEYMKHEASSLKAHATIFIDQDYIYLQMQHDKHYLYEIIPRKQAGNKENVRLHLSE